MAKAYKGHESTFYCDCSYKDKKVDLASCGYIPRKYKKRASRIEWEHVVPAYAFGQSFPEWRDGHSDCVTKEGKPYKGRKCVKKTKKLFKEMEADPVNLVPAIGEINGDRSHYSFAMIPGESREYGDCDIEIENKKAEPWQKVRGDIARIYFYMDKRYPGRVIISKENRKLFEEWNRKDPVSDWEKHRNRRIFEVFKIFNSFVEVLEEISIR